jgi:predicted Zn-dependent peptidase
VQGFLASALYKGVAYGGEVSYVGPVAASTSDDRAFAYIRLENGLQALLVSDPDADTTAASLDVRVGSWYDPQQFPGLAHAVEHCLFLGASIRAVSAPDHSGGARVAGHLIARVSR